MKKIILLFAVFFFGITVNAQLIEKMIEFKREGDVLLNIPASTGWDSPHVMIVEFEDGDSKIRLEHGSNIFMNNPIEWDDMI